METLGGLLLFITAVLALVVANSPYRDAYNYFLQMKSSLTLIISYKKPLVLWINDGLMAIYFMLMGLEIKREIKLGVLSNKTSLTMPAITALSGLLVPALIFPCLIYETQFTCRMGDTHATDIAFTLGIVSILGSRRPLSFKFNAFSENRYRTEFHNRRTSRI